MVIEKFIRYVDLAVGLKPSAMGCEARLRGRERMNCSKTILPAATRRGRDARAPGRVGYPGRERLPAPLPASPRWGEEPGFLL